MTLMSNPNSILEDDKSSVSAPLDGTVSNVFDVKESVSLGEREAITETKEKTTLPLSLLSAHPAASLYDTTGTQIPKEEFKEVYSEGIKTGATVGIPAIGPNIVSFSTMINDLIADYAEPLVKFGFTGAAISKVLKPSFDAMNNVVGRPAFNELITNSKFGEFFDITQQDLENPASLVGEMLVTMPLVSSPTSTTVASPNKFPADKLAFWKQFNEYVDNRFNNMKRVYSGSDDLALAGATTGGGPSRALTTQSDTLFMAGEGGGKPPIILPTIKDSSGTYKVTAKVLENAKVVNNRSRKNGAIYNKIPNNTKEAKNITNPLTLDTFITDFEEFIQPMAPVGNIFQTKPMEKFVYGAPPAKEGSQALTTDALAQSNYKLQASEINNISLHYGSVIGQGTGEGSTLGNEIDDIKYLSPKEMKNKGIKIPGSSFMSSIKSVDETGYTVKQRYYAHPETIEMTKAVPIEWNTLMPPNEFQRLLENTDAPVLNEGDKFADITRAKGFQIGHYRGHDVLIPDQNAPVPSHGMEILKHFQFTQPRKDGDYVHNVAGISNLKDPLGFLSYYNTLFSTETFSPENSWGYKDNTRRTSIYPIEKFQVQKVNYILDNFDIPIPINKFESLAEELATAVDGQKQSDVNTLKSQLESFTTDNLLQKERFLKHAEKFLDIDEEMKLQLFLKKEHTEYPQDPKSTISDIALPPLLPVNEKLTSQKYNEILEFVKENFNESSMALFNELNQYIATWTQNYVHSALGTDIFRNRGKISYMSQAEDFDSPWLEDVLYNFGMNSRGWENSPAGDRNKFLKYPYEFFNSNQVNRQVSHLDENEALKVDMRKRLGENFQQGIMDYINKSARQDKAEPVPRSQEILDSIFTRSHDFSKEDIYNIMQKLTPSLEEPDVEKVISLMKNNLQVNKEMFAFLRKHNAGRNFNVKVNPATGIAEKTTIHKAISTFSQGRGFYDDTIEKGLSSKFHNISANFEIPFRRWLELGGKNIMALSPAPAERTTDLILDKNNKIVVGKHKEQAAYDTVRKWNGNVSRTIVEMQLDPFKQKEIFKWRDIVRDAQRKVVEHPSEEVKDKFFKDLIASGWARPETWNTITRNGVTLIDSDADTLIPKQIQFALASAKFLDEQTPTVDLAELTAGELYFASLAKRPKNQMQAQVLAILQKAEKDGVTEVLFPDGGTAATIQSWRNNLSSTERTKLFQEEMKSAPEVVKQLFNSISKEYIPTITTQISGERGVTYTRGLNTLLPIDKNSDVADSAIGQLLKRHLYYVEGGKHSVIDATGKSTYSPFNQSHLRGGIEQLVDSQLLHSEFHEATKIFTDTLQQWSSNAKKVNDLRGLEKPLYPDNLHLANIFNEYASYITQPMKENAAIVIDNIQQYGWQKNQLPKINDTYMQPVLLDLAYLISKGFISKAMSAGGLDFDLIQHTPLPSNYFNTKSNFMASNRKSPELETKVFYGMQEHLESPVMISTILQLYNKEIAEKLLLTIFEKELAPTRTYGLLGKSQVDTNKLLNILNEKLEGPFTNAIRLFNVGKPLADIPSTRIKGELRKNLQELHANVSSNIGQAPVRRGELVVGQVFSKENFIKELSSIKPEELTLDDLQLKAAFIDEVAAWSKSSMTKAIPSEEFNKFFSSTKRYGKVASTYGTHLPNALSDMQIPFSIGPASRFAPGRFDKLKDKGTRFYRVDVKKAIEAIEKTSPTLFGLGGAALTGLGLGMAEEEFNEMGDVTTGPPL